MNMKRMWCHFTCSPNKADFVTGNGYQIDSDPIAGNVTLVEYNIDPLYACSVFQSCEKVSIVAQASLQSSIAFLDFMGFNGKEQSHMIMGFNFSSDPNATMSTEVYPCNFKVPANGNFTGYTKVGNCSCASCDQACPAPPVDAFIGFFDGFNGVLVAIVYGGLIAFSVVFQVIKRKLQGKP